MASNSGTSLIVGNGKRNQLYRESNAVYQPGKHGVIKGDNCTEMFRHHLISSIDFNHHQSATMNSAWVMQVRRTFESTTRCRQFAMNHAKDYARDILEFPKDDDFRHKISNKVAVSANKRLF